jgi:hypothetical protein
MILLLSYFSDDYLFYVFLLFWFEIDFYYLWLCVAFVDTRI